MLRDLVEDLLTEVTPRMRLPSNWKPWAISYKCTCLVSMHPQDFLDLTIHPNDPPIVSRGPFLGLARKLKHEPEATIAPFLDINLDKERVTAHEGRHRALSFLEAGGEDYPVVIKLIPRRDAEPKYLYRGNDVDWYKYINPEYLMTAADIPAIVESQYTTKTISTRRWKILEADILKQFKE